MHRSVFSTMKPTNKLFISKNWLKLATGLSLSCFTYKYLHLDHAVNNDIMFLENDNKDLFQKPKMSLPEILEKNESKIFVLTKKDGTIVSNGIHIYDGIIAVLLENHNVDELKKKNFSLHTIKDLQELEKDTLEGLNYIVIEIPDMSNLCFIKLVPKKSLSELDLENFNRSGDKTVSFGLDSYGNKFLSKGNTIESGILQQPHKEYVENLSFPISSMTENSPKPINGVSYPVFNEIGELKGLCFNDGSASYYVHASDFKSIIKLISENKVFERKHLGMS